MNIRSKLFIFIPLLVVLINSVSFLIHQSGKKVQENYNLMIDRILLYKQVSQKTNENLRVLSSYLILPDTGSRHEVYTQRKALTGLKRNLNEMIMTDLNEIALKNYGNMLASFLEQEEAILKAVDAKNMQSYFEHYEEVEKTAGFIQEEGQHLVDLELSYYQPVYRKILANTETMNILGLWLFVVNMVMGIVFAIWLSRSITRPISSLVHTAKQISKGNLQIKPPAFGADNEFRILAETFQQMLANIRKLIAKDKENLEKDRLVKELELKALQSQINPHFLFNSLNVLSKLALLEGAEMTSDLTVSMSNLLRYNLRKLDKPVTLREEVQNAEEYFSIQQARFRDRIRFETEIDENALNQPIPCLTIQPILENAFVHGVESMEEGAVVQIVIRKAAEEVIVQISDNGVGMSEEARTSLLNYSFGSLSQGGSGQSTGLGTHNVFKRLQIFYNRNDLVEIDSRMQKGTTVTLHLPIPKEEQVYV